MKRMWINQPSTLQPLHHLHGTNVLASHDYSDTWTIYFLSGPVVSQQILILALSDGWTAKAEHKELIKRSIGLLQEALKSAES